MHLEISSAVNFISFIIEISYRNHLYKISKNNLKKFRKNLKKILKQNFKNQWFPNNPHKASSLRTLRINNQGIDSRIELACLLTNISSHSDKLDAIFRINHDGCFYNFKEGFLKSFKETLIQDVT